MKSAKNTLPLLAKTGTALSFVAGILLLCNCEPSQPLNNRAADALLSQFKGSCVTRGQWTEAAITQNKALRSVLDQLKDLSECKNLDKELAVVGAVGLEVDRALADPAFREHLQNMGNVTDQALSLFKYAGEAATTFNPATFSEASISELSKNLFRSIIKASGDGDSARTAYKPENKEDDVLRNSSRMLISKLQTMMSDMNGLQKCIKQSPSASIQIASQVMALAGGAASPVKGAAIGLASQFLAAAISTLSDEARIDRASYKIGKSEMPVALTCALESMTETYCQAEDVRELVEFQASSYNRKQDVQIDGIWKGMDILTRRLPLIADMLRRVRYGNDPSDSFDANRKGSVLSKPVKILMLDLDIKGLISQEENMWIKVGKGKGDVEQQRQAILVGLLQSLAGKVGGGFGEEQGEFKMPSDPKRVACMFAIDANPNNCPGFETDLSSQQRLEQYIRKYLVDGDKQTNFQKIRANWNRMLSQVNDLVNAEMAQQITIDPRLTVASIMEPSSIDNISPYEALERIVSFTDDLKALLLKEPDTNYNNMLVPILDETKAKITEVLNLVKHRTRKDGTIVADTDDQEIIKTIYDVFQLRIGTQFITDRVKALVEWDLNRRLKLGELPDATAAILTAAGGMMSDELGGRTFGLDRVQLDLDHSQSLMQSNISDFLNIFHGNPLAGSPDIFFEATKLLAHQAREADEAEHGMRRPNGNSLAELCVLDLTSNVGPNELSPAHSPVVLKTWKGGSRGAFLPYCSGATLESVYNKHLQNDSASTSTVAGFPLALSYNKLFDFYSVGDPKTAETLQKAGRYIVEKTVPDYLLKKGHQFSDWISPPPANEEDKNLYAEIFHNLVAGPAPERRQEYNKKVCTFHRFLRAGRIMESFPALGLPKK